MVKLQTRGKWLKKEAWYSICSSHLEDDPECSRCQVGAWHNVYLLKVGSIVFKIAPRLWRWNANRKSINDKLTNKED